MELPKNKYQVIYADPAWRYDYSISNSRKIENQYPTMDLNDIKELKVNDIADENCVLFLWATSPKLTEALEVMQSWGFNYRTCLIWDKEVIGMGYWFRNQHELLLVGTKGKISPPNPKERISSIFKEKRGKHSKKPDRIRELIAEWYKSSLKIALFARQRYEGWDSWGNELQASIC